MTNQYDGPSFFRHPSKIGSDEIKQPERQILHNAKKTLERVYVPPVMANKKVREHLNLTKIMHQLHKASDDYYVSVSDQKMVQANKKLDKSTVKMTKQSSSNKALGHSLGDILKSEQDAQRDLAIFKHQG